jgi:hypothetical protein
VGVYTGVSGEQLSGLDNMLSSSRPISCCSESGKGIDEAVVGRKCRSLELPVTGLWPRGEGGISSSGRAGAEMTREVSSRFDRQVLALTGLETSHPESFGEQGRVMVIVCLEPGKTLGGGGTGLGCDAIIPTGRCSIFRIGVGYSYGGITAAVTSSPLFPTRGRISTGRCFFWCRLLQRKHRNAMKSTRAPVSVPTIAPRVCADMGTGVSSRLGALLRDVWINVRQKNSTDLPKRRICLGRIPAVCTAVTACWPIGCGGGIS